MSELADDLPALPEWRDRRLAVILTVSLAIHMGVAVWAHLADPRSDLWFTDPPRRDFAMETVPETLDVSMIEAGAIPDPAGAAAPATAPAAPAPAPAPRGRSHRGSPPPRDLDPAAVASALFSEDGGARGPRGALGGRRPGGDLAEQLADARRRDAEASLGDGSDRPRGDPSLHLGTGHGPALGDPDGPAATVKTVEAAPLPAPRRAPDEAERARGTTLGPDDVLALINARYLDGLKRCHAALLAVDPRAGGKVTLRFSVEPDGSVSSPEADGFDASVDRCITGRVARWTFPAPRDPDSGAPVAARFQLTLALQPE